MTKNLPSVDDQPAADVPDFTKPIPAGIALEDTPAEPPNPKYRSPALADVQAEYGESIVDADELLAEIVAEGRDEPMLAETIYLKRHCGWDEREIRRQIGRMRTVIRWQGIAGTPADREAAKKEAAKSANVLAAEGPKIAAEIEKLQAKLRSLETDARLSQKRVDEHAEAIEKLRVLAPEHIRKQADQLQVDAQTGPRMKMLELKKRRDLLERFQLAPDSNNRVNTLRALRNFEPAAVVMREHMRQIQYDYAPEWESIKKRWNKEIASLEPQIAKAEAEYEAAEAAAAAARDYYIGG